MPLDKRAIDTLDATMKTNNRISNFIVAVKIKVVTELNDMEEKVDKKISDYKKINGWDNHFMRTDPCGC